MTIKQQGGIFGRNPTFNDVDVEGTLTVNGEPISDFGSLAQQDANSVAITGGDIDGTAIGSTSQSTGDFTEITGSGDMNIDNNTFFVDASANKVGVRTNLPEATLHVSDPNANAEILFESTHSSGIPNLQLKGAGSATFRYLDENGTIQSRLDLRDSGQIRFFGSSETMRIEGNDLKLTGGGNVVVNSGKGIDFSATSGTGTSELFDDYEEGAYTGTLTPETSGSITVNAAAARMNYTKIGRVVFVSGFLEAGSVSSPVGANVLLNLPFTVSSLPYDSSRMSSGIYVDNTLVPVRVFNGGTTARIGRDASLIASGDQFYISFNYIAA